MSPRENLQRLVAGQSGQWIPFTLDVGAIPGFTKPVLKKFEQATGASDPAEYFDFDFRTFSLTARFGGEDPTAFHQGQELKPGTTFDEWGIGHWSGDREGLVEKICSPLAKAESIRDVEALAIPLIEEPVDTSPLPAFHQRGYPVFGYAGSLYEWSWWIRGMDKFMMDMITAPDIAEAILHKVKSYTKQLALATAAAGIDVLCFYDDVGMQTAMQISPDLWRRMFKPAWQEILDTVKHHYPQSLTFLHSCGNIRQILPDIVEIGFDILHPLQPECMDFPQIHREFGKELLLCATMSSQKTFPFGSPQDIRRQVREYAQLCRADNRLILCPSNMLQPETPWENILAFVEEAKAL